MTLHVKCQHALRLHHAPFDDLPGEAFVYTDLLLESMTETMRQALCAPGAMITLTGADGSGRTLQLMRLLGVLPERFLVVAFRGRAEIPFQVVDATIRNQLGMGQRGEQVTMLRDLLLEHLQAGAEMVIAIDDAHLLGSTILHELIQLRHRLQGQCNNPPRLIFVGDGELMRYASRFSELAEGQEAVSRFEIRPFNIEQSKAYLYHRLHAAGMTNPAGFLSAEDVQLLQQRSHGYPKLLNAMANEWLEERCQDAWGDPSTRAITERIRRLSLAMREEEGPNAESPFAMALDAEESPAEAADSRLAEEKVELRSAPVRSRRAAPAPGLTAQALQWLIRMDLWNRRWFVPALASTVVLAIVAPVALQMGSNDNSRVVSPQARENPVASAAGSPQPPVSSPSAVIASRTASAPVPTRTDITPGQLLAPPPSAPEVPSPPVRESSPAAPVAMVMPAVNLDKGRLWAREQEDDRYTIQLIAVSQTRAAREYVARHRLVDTHFLSIRSGNRDLVIILLGSFRNRAQAEEAYRALPAQVQADQPWIRDFGSVHKALK